jgi:hypothetical protein
MITSDEVDRNLKFGRWLHNDIIYKTGRILCREFAQGPKSFSALQQIKDRRAWFPVTFFEIITPF